MCGCLEGRSSEAATDCGHPRAAHGRKARMPGVRIPVLAKAHGFCAGTGSAGLVVAALATRRLPESQRRTGRFDLPGGFTGMLGVASLVYGGDPAVSSLLSPLAVPLLLLPRDAYPAAWVPGVGS